MFGTGELEVRSKGQRLGFLSDGSFFGEAAIMSMAGELRSRTVIGERTKGRQHTGFAATT